MREPGHYPYAPYTGRPKITWPGGNRLAFWVGANIEFYEWAPPPSNTRSVWYQPEPDITNYSHRDYGNRVAFDRMADVMADHGVRGSVSLNVALCDHLPGIIDRCCELEWELFSHGIYNTRYLYDMTEDQQREVIRDARDTIKRASGQTLDGWLSPAVSNIETTQHVLAEEGIKYTLDLMHDDQPTPLNVRAGKLISIPYAIELNDVPFFNFRGLSTSEYVTACKAQCDQLLEEGEESGTVMCLPLHPYVIAQPHRIEAFSEILDYICSKSGVWLATGREIADHFLDHHEASFRDWLGMDRGATA
ncbi:polysaccharide deacetylase family protein [Tropicimonas isoalkanivorans]|uniref:Chitooligosaccharide deacetylase n=1 Tax=Tropicimonas isoalkanivorans TaxID=441112 RepID=A0A1I1KPU4_9RHOB|nr:polysaccharide deacetylase family protein [Tropicimonas isoalkanivorans]SFC62876.1 Peptidoglycan/xylan/chitin deacetylase, PgdA/CDA1 family [Tropicimonas isoalkanivorans]